MQTILFFLAFLAVSSASDVVELGDDDFADRIADMEVALVKFYAPWCGHCKKMVPEFDKASTILLENDPPVHLVKVDCTVHTKTCGKYGVSGYPTLKLFRGDVDNAEDYNGPRESDGIVTYMRSKAGPSAKELTDLAAAEKFLSHSEHSIVGFFDSVDSKMYRQFVKLADTLSENHRFAYTINKAVSEKYGYDEDIVIFQPKQLVNKFDPSEVKYEGDDQIAKLKTFISDNLHGYAGYRTMGNQNQFKRPLVVAYFDVDYTKNPKGTNYWRNRVMKVAKKLQGEGRSVYFAIANKDMFGQELQETGLEAYDDKPVVAARDASELKYAMKDEFTVENLENFVIRMLDGKEKPYLKSEPIPTDDGPVKTVVGENFNDIVNDETKDVLIEFYAPWCGHCKSLVPKYEELAEMLSDEESVVIAKMDATANDVPKPYNVGGFPTIYYSPKNSKDSPKKYEGGREVKDFLKYLAKESTDGLKGYDRSGKKQKSKEEL